MTRDDDYIGSLAYDCGYRAGQAHAAGSVSETKEQTNG
jgi:hypothetical protein